MGLQLWDWLRIILFVHVALSVGYACSLMGSFERNVERDPRLQKAKDAMNFSLSAIKRKRTFLFLMFIMFLLMNFIAFKYLILLKPQKKQ